MTLMTADEKQERTFFHETSALICDICGFGFRPSDFCPLGILPTSPTRGWHGSCLYAGMETIVRLFLAGLLSLSFASVEKAHASYVRLSWTPCGYSGTAGYNVYYGTTSGIYLYKVNAGNGTSVTISNLTPGVTYYFAATTYDVTGHESQLSPQISFLAGYDLEILNSAVSGGPVSLQFQVQVKHWYEIQATTDLQTWTTIWASGTALANFTFAYTDPAAGAYRSRFYRLVVH